MPAQAAGGQRRVVKKAWGRGCRHPPGGGMNAGAGWRRPSAAGGGSFITGSAVSLMIRLLYQIPRSPTSGSEAAGNSAVGRRVKKVVGRPSTG